MNDTEVANESLRAARIDDSADQTEWNPQTFQVPRFFAFDVGGLLMKCLLYAALAGLGTAAIQWLSL